MSRVHDALRRAEQLLETTGNVDENIEKEAVGIVVADEDSVAGQPAHIEIPPNAPPAAPRANGLVHGESKPLEVDWRNFLVRCRAIPFRPAPETHLIDVERPHEVPAEEFRSLRTRLNHLQSQQDLHLIVVTSASPAEGKTFTAASLDEARTAARDCARLLHIPLA